MRSWGSFIDSSKMKVSYDDDENQSGLLALSFFVILYLLFTWISSLTNFGKFSLFACPASNRHNAMVQTIYKEYWTFSNQLHMRVRHSVSLLYINLTISTTFNWSDRWLLLPDNA